MKTPIVSVLIPVYNVEKYVGKCLDSVISQTLNNIEIICVNDGSTDSSAEILEEYKKKDSRIKVITKENGGLPSARNAGLEVARGKYIGFVDSDDYIEPNMYEVMVNNAILHDSDVVICGANIFPEEPRANQWTYDVLSPRARHYDKFDSDILFRDVDTSPFLWRTIVSKRLIDSHDFRLDEDVILGEDKAFQCKIYPYAKGITVIPDKLYNYYWCRPGSLMAQDVYEGLTNKVSKHAKLVTSIAKYIGDSELDKKEKKIAIKNYLDWSIPFIYSDFIYCSLAEKIEISKQLIKCFEGIGVYAFMGYWEDWKKEQYSYIKLFESVNRHEKEELSIIIPAEYEDEYVDDIFTQLDNINQSEIEFIFINNGISNNRYARLLKLMKRKMSIRLYNTQKHLSYAELLNIGIGLTNGEYISILDPRDWYCSADKLVEWLKFAKKGNYDCCISEYIKKNSPTELVGETISFGKQNSKIWEHDFHDALYKKSFLVENNLEFRDYSVLSGLDFLSRSIFAADKIGFYKENVYCNRKYWKQDWLKTENCEKLLECLNNLLLLSLENKSAYLHCKVFNLLNSDEFKKIIVNGTKLYPMSIYDCPNGENGQVKTIVSLYSIIEGADEDMLAEGGFKCTDRIMDILYEVINERQKFLANI